MINLIVYHPDQLSEPILTVFWLSKSSIIPNMYIKLYKTNEYSYDQMSKKIQNSEIKCNFFFKVKIILLLQKSWVEKMWILGWQKRKTNWFWRKWGGTLKMSDFWEKRKTHKNAFFPLTSANKNTFILKKICRITY